MGKPMIKVALTGGMRSGKSTIAYLIRTQDFSGLRQESFGSGIRTIADTYFNHLYEEEITGEFPFEDRKIIKPRNVLQQIGQLMRTIDEDVWIKQVELGIRSGEYFKGFNGVIIDDLRQPNEYEWAKRNGFVIIKVDTPDDVRIERIKSNNEQIDETINHETEAYYDTFDVDMVINGSMSMDELEVFIKDAYASGKFNGKSEGWDFIA